MPNVLWQLQSPRALEHVTIHDVTKADGSSQWERHTAKYDAQGFSEIKTEVLKDYEGASVDKAVLSSPDPRMVAAFDNNVADLSNFLGWMAEPMQQQRDRKSVV